VYSRDRLIEYSSAFFKRLNLLIREVFVFRIGTYACDFNFLIEIAVSFAMISINKLPPDCLYFINVPICEIIAPGEPSIVIDDDQELFVLLAEGAYKTFEKISMHEIKKTLISDENRLFQKGFNAHLASLTVITNMHVLRTELYVYRLAI
jgi:hypothetical protein